jgi:hypothetical protein
MKARDYVGDAWDGDAWRIAAILLDTYGVRTMAEAVGEASRERDARGGVGEGVRAPGLWNDVYRALSELLRLRPEAGELVH